MGSLAAVAWCDACEAMRLRGVLRGGAHVPACAVAQQWGAGLCYLIAGGWVYDATPFLAAHPGGARAIRNRAIAGVDCEQDMRFHSAAARARWRRLRIGQFVECGVVPSPTSGCAVM